jgi:uncharacterized protein (DUF3820 family)
MPEGKYEGELISDLGLGYLRGYVNAAFNMKPKNLNLIESIEREIEKRTIRRVVP